MFSLEQFLDSSSEAYVLKISDMLEMAGLFFFVHQGDIGFSIYPLNLKIPRSPSSAIGLGFSTQEFTGDKSPEIAISHYFFPGSGDAITTYFGVFDISSGIPVQLEFDPPLGVRRERSWELIQQSNSSPHFKLTLVFDRSMCPFTESLFYQWDGNKFILIRQELPTPEQLKEQLGVPSGQTTVNDCMDIYVSRLVHTLYYGEVDLLPTLLEYIEGWPHSENWGTIKEPLVATSHDLKFLIGLYMANLSEFELANGLFQDILDSSSVRDELTEFVRTFVGIDTTIALVDACRASGICYSLLNGDEFLEQLTSSSGEDPITLFREIGMPIEQGSKFDLDRDGTDDIWFVKIKIDREEWIEDTDLPSYWIIFIHESEGKYLLEYLQEYYPDLPYVEPGPSYFGYPSLIVSSLDNRDVYIYRGSVENHFLYKLCEMVSDEILGIEPLLFDANPKELLTKMEESISIHRAACFSEADNYLEPALLFFHAMLNEILDNSSISLDDYLALIRIFPESPYSLLAAGRLKVVP